MVVDLEEVPFQYLKRGELLLIVRLRGKSSLTDIRAKHLSRHRREVNFVLKLNK